MSNKTLTILRHKNDFAVAKPRTGHEFKRYLKIFRSRFYIMVDATTDALWMGLGNKLVKLYFPKHNHENEQGFSAV